MYPLLMDAAVSARQEELRRAAHEARLRRPARLRSLPQPAVAAASACTQTGAGVTA